MPLFTHTAVAFVVGTAAGAVSDFCCQKLEIASRLKRADAVSAAYPMKFPRHADDHGKEGNGNTNVVTTHYDPDSGEIIVEDITINWDRTMRFALVGGLKNVVVQVYLNVVWFFSPGKDWESILYKIAITELIMNPLLVSAVLATNTILHDGEISWNVWSVVKKQLWPVAMLQVPVWSAFNLVRFQLPMAWQVPAGILLDTATSVYISYRANTKAFPNDTKHVVEIVEMEEEEIEG
eukprot:PhM_4_TR1852/c0_g1_i1/m.61562